MGEYDWEKGWDRNWELQPRPPEDRFLNLEKNFEGRDLELLKEYELPRPNDIFEINPKVLDLNLEQLKDNIKQLVKLVVESKLKIHLHCMKLKLKLKKCKKEH